MTDFLDFICAVFFIGINVFSFLAFGFDKLNAKKGSWRIPERTLLWWSFWGGATGAILGMFLFHHKIRKRKFYFFVPFFFLLQIVVFLCFFYGKM